MSAMLLKMNSSVAKSYCPGVYNKIKINICLNNFLCVLSLLQLWWSYLHNSITVSLWMNVCGIVRRIKNEDEYLHSWNVSLEKFSRSLHSSSLFLVTVQSLYLRPLLFTLSKQAEISKKIFKNHCTMLHSTHEYSVER